MDNKTRPGAVKQIAPQVKPRQIQRHVRFIPTEDGNGVTIEIDAESLPFNLRRYAAQLAGNLRMRYRDSRLTRQVKREIEREVCRWITKYKDPGFIKWDGQDKFELIKTKFPVHLQDKLKNLADLMNLVFYEYPDTEETRQIMLLFIQEWIETNSLVLPSEVQNIHEDILTTIRDEVGDNPIETTETREKVSALIMNLVRKKREELLHERIIETAKSAGTGNSAPRSEIDGEPEQSAEPVSGTDQ